METRGIDFEVNRVKAIEAILYILEKRVSVNQYNILKIIFAADKHHLNEHGRPVTGDKIIKMELGPVPSFVYGHLKEVDRLKSLGDVKALGNYLFQGLRKADRNQLSESDIESLDYGVKEYIDLSFGAVYEKSHKEKCWQEGVDNMPISFESMIESQEVLDFYTANPARVVV